MARRFLLLAVTASTTALAACGSSTKTITTTVPGNSTPAPQPSSPSRSDQDQAANTVAQRSFQSPSTNIGCTIVGGTARCDIKQRSWSPPARPSSCPSEVDFGQGLTVGESGSARFVCAGDTALNPTAPKLAYGKASHVGGFTCTSETTGVACRNDATGHGFMLSRESYRFF